MGSTAKNILLLIISLVIGISVTYLGVSLIQDVFPIDQLLQIIVAVVLTIFAYMCFYFMTKGSG
ncbi:MAG: hypothetical protein V1827_03635 [Candidatus Micrarchaeota archaeon]